MLLDNYTFFIYVSSKLDASLYFSLGRFQRSVFGGSVWTWNEPRKQYYMHQFSPEQVDLDFRNPFVQQEMEVRNRLLEILMKEKLCENELHQKEKCV